MQVSLRRSFIAFCVIACVSAACASAADPSPVRAITNTIAMKLVRIPAGQFEMGSAESAEQLAQAYKRYWPEIKADDFKSEYPLHTVRITKPFYLGAYEVTVAQFRAFVEAENYRTEAERDRKGGEGIDPATGVRSQKREFTWKNPGYPQTDEHPVVNVSHNDALAFCRWLSRKEGKEYRLPTEAEWEYACRAGTQTRYYHGDDPEGLAAVGNVGDGTAKAKFAKWDAGIAAQDGYAFAAPVGKFKPNAFGLYDMHGNVGEWCADWEGEKYYSESPADDPKGPSSGWYRILRGGSWGTMPNFSRSASRFGLMSSMRLRSLGFRVARSE